MPTYVYECPSDTCAKNAHEDGWYVKSFERNVLIRDRDSQTCDFCARDLDRKIAFTGLTWAPTAGGMR